MAERFKAPVLTRRPKAGGRIDAVDAKPATPRKRRDAT